MNRRRLGHLLDWFLIFFLAAVLILPLFGAGFLDLWGSIESTFISDARFLRDNWLHPNWQPNWYCGTRTDYIYPPALRYGTAAISKAVPNLLPVRAYHIYVAFFYCFGIAAVYLLARVGSQSRLAGWIAAAAAALISPSYLLVHQIRDDTPWQMPYRLAVLIRYGEGPHMTALAWLPLALLFGFRALQRWRPVSFALATVCSAMVVSTNFYGATALALLMPLLAWAIFITHLDRWIWVRAAGIAALAYGLTAFWLVPSYVRITLANMRFVSSEGNLWSIWAFLGVIVAYVLLSILFGKGKKDSVYLVFLCGALAVFLTNVVGHHYLNLLVFGNPARLFPELDLILILLAVELLRRFWLGAAWRKAIAAAVVVGALTTSYDYLQNSWRLFVADHAPTQRVEYRMQDWVANNMPRSRVFTAGSIRFWYNAWHDLPQVGGGSDQGLLNPMVMPLQWEVLLGDNLNLALWWLQLSGADAAIVSEQRSSEHYHDYQHPEKFRGNLPVLHDDGEGNIIYGVPRRYKSLARVVDRAHLDSLPEIPGNGDEASLKAWVEAIEYGADAQTETAWLSTDSLLILAPVQEGESVFLQVSFDPNWRAYVDGQRVPVRRNPLGFMTIDATPGTEEIRLEFPTPFENVVGRGIAVLSILILGGLLYRGRSRITAMKE